MAKHLDSFKSELVSFSLLQVMSKESLKTFLPASELSPKHLQSANYGAEECWKEMFSFLVETMETAVKSWHEASKVDTRVYFLLDKEKTETDKFVPAVNIDKV